MAGLRIVSMLGGALMASACAMPQAGNVPAGTPVPIEAESIRYETGPCFGACPVYVVTVRPDGTGTFVGDRFTAVTGSRDFTLTRAQYDAFARALSPYRPDGERRLGPGDAACQPVATDMPSVDVRWSHNTGAADDHLSYYFGCAMQTNAAMADALRHAPDALPIGDLIGRR